MSTIHVHVPSFNAGELSPLIGARFGVEKVASGCRLLRNFIPHVLGPAFRRPGMQFMATAVVNNLLVPSRVIGFDFSVGTSCVLELSPFGNLIVWVDGARVTQASPPSVPWNDLTMLRWVQVNDVVYFAHRDFAPRKLTRLADDSWTLAEIAFDSPPVGDENVDPAITITPSATTGSVTLISSAGLFVAGHVGSTWRITHRRAENSVSIVAAQPVIAAANSTELAVSREWEVSTYGTWTTTLYLERKRGAVWETLRTWVGNSDRNVIANGELDEAGVLRLRVLAGTSAPAAGAAVPRFVLECPDARQNGYAKITAIVPQGGDPVAGPFTGATATVTKDLFATTATSLWTKAAWSQETGYPAAVALHGARLWFGGTAAEPLRLWGSVINDYENFQRGTRDDESVSFQPAAMEANRIKWLASLGENLIVGTAGDEWTLSGGTDQGPITPTSVLMQRRSGYGSDDVQGILLGETLVFAQRGCLKVRGVAPRQDGLIWQATNLTELAEHITLGGISTMAVQMFPWSILWTVTMDGRLLGLTFEQEQNVFAWHAHSTDGTIESVAVIHGAATDEVWLLVIRNGVRQVERLDLTALAHDFDTPADLMYLDSAKMVQPSPSSATLTGLSHLEGRAVKILSNGVEYAGTVALGSVTIPVATTKAIVGLPFTSQLQPMRFDVPLQDGTATHRLWRTSRVGVYLHSSMGGEIAHAPDGRFDVLNYRDMETPADVPLPLFTGEREIMIEGRVTPGPDVIIRTSSPFPLNVGSITLKGDLHGE